MTKLRNITVLYYKRLVSTCQAKNLSVVTLRVAALWLGIFLVTEAGLARPPDEPEFLAASIGAEEIADWIWELKEKPRALGVFSVRVNEPLEQDYGAIVEAEILKDLAAKGIDKVSSCLECRSMQVGVSGGNLIVQKGAPDLDTLKKIGANQPVEAFLVVDIYRTKLAIIMQATLYRNPAGTVISAERFRIPALSFTDAAVQILFTFGSGKLVGGSSSGSGLIPAISLQLLEELGMGKGGLNLGVVAGGGTLIYLNPTYSFRKRFGTSGLGWSLNLGAGYGLSGSTQGLSTRAAYELYLGSLTVIGAEFDYLIPLNDATSAFKGFVGFHIGLSFGR